MDALDNLIFATLRSPLQSGAGILSEFIPNPFGGFLVGQIPTGGFNPVFGYSLADKETFTSYTDYSIFEDAILRHWYDINGNGVPGSLAENFLYEQPPAGVLSDFSQSSNYHLIYAYLIENTRILQIFERLIEMYLNDEGFGIAPANVYQWLINSERLFFKAESGKVHNNRSLIRPNSESNRRNAYYRMFGIDLAFGDINSGSGGIAQYHKAKTANQQFIPLFERYLAEVWQGYTNARNSIGPNTTDVNNLVLIASQLRELLRARRGRRPGGGLNEYMASNLSAEEFAAVIFVSWFTFIISDDTEVVKFLNCQSSTIGERLIKIGEKVGIPAHTKCQSMFEMAAAASNLLNVIEIGSFLENDTNVQTMLSSLNPGTPASINSDFMRAFLIVINNWEKATGHKIKNPESNITGTVTVQQNGVKARTMMN